MGTSENSIELVERGVYRLHSRNLEYGVYTGDGGFIGIREKAGDRYLDKEYMTRGEWRGTAVALELVGRVEDGICLSEYLRDMCANCRGAVSFVEWGPGETGTGKGRWVCEDTTCTKSAPRTIMNDALFAALGVFNPQGA